MACPTSPGAATPANARRWKQRPEGATGGDFGAGDPIGRLDLPTPERVKRAVPEVREGSRFCLSLPLGHPGGNPLTAAPLPLPGAAGSPVTSVGTVCLPQPQRDFFHAFVHRRTEIGAESLPPPVRTDQPGAA